MESQNCAMRTKFELRHEYLVTPITSSFDSQSFDEVLVGGTLADRNKIWSVRYWSHVLDVMCTEMYFLLPSEPSPAGWHCADAV